MKTPIIFLDHDGVICLADQFGSRFKKRNRPVHETVSMKDLPILERFDNFDRKAVKVLNRILEETGAEIVVSSDWKTWANLEELGQYYEQQGIIKKPIALTPKAEDLLGWEWSYLTHRHDQLEEARCHEIQHWLKTNPHGKWVAVDDMFLGRTPMGGQSKWGLEHFIHTPRMREGIKQSGVAEKIIKTLKG
jgi:hypothetical protein